MVFLQSQVKFVLLLIDSQKNGGVESVIFYILFRF